MKSLQVIMKNGHLCKLPGNSRVPFVLTQLSTPMLQLVFCRPGVRMLVLNEPRLYSQSSHTRRHT